MNQAHPDPVDELHTERSHRVNTRRAALRQARDVFAAARRRGLAKRHAAKLRRLAGQDESTEEGVAQ